MLEEFPSPYHTLPEGGHTPGEGADFLVGEVTDTISRVRTEQGLLTYLQVKPTHPVCYQSISYALAAHAAMLVIIVMRPYCYT